MLAAGAAEWAARAVTGNQEGTTSPDPTLPGLGVGYCVAADEAGADTINLISAALAARIITDAPSAADITGLVTH